MVVKFWDAVQATNVLLVLPCVPFALERASVSSSEFECLQQVRSRKSKSVSPKVSSSESRRNWLRLERVCHWLFGDRHEIR